MNEGGGCGRDKWPQGKRESFGDEWDEGEDSQRGHRVEGSTRRNKTSKRERTGKGAGGRRVDI